MTRFTQPFPLIALYIMLFIPKVLSTEALADSLLQAPAISPPDRAYSGKLTYDPSKCSRDAQGMVYFALGRRVLRQPARNLTYMVGLDAEDRRTIPRLSRPEEPEGCPDHPIQQAVYYLAHVSAMPGDPPNAASKHADQVSLIVHAGTRPSSQNKLFESMCRTHKLWDYSVQGFVGCKKPYHCNEDVAYQATDYAAPDGTKLALDCEVGPHCTTQLARCDGGYVLRDHFVVNLKFVVATLPIEDLPAADEEVRRRLSAAEVSDFEWAP